MEKKHVEYQIIEIPAGTKFIEACSIPQWIAEYLVSIPDAPPLMADLKKKISGEEVDLTDEDVWLLRGIWSHLPIPAAWNVTEERFALCRASFEKALGRPDWQLANAYGHNARNGCSNSQGRTAEGQHRQDARRAPGQVLINRSPLAGEWENPGNQ